jgi:uncharacterized protein (TIGR03437 family)
VSLLALLVLAACDPGGGARLDSVNPAAASAGARVLVTGSGLCGRALDADGLACTDSLVGRVFVGAEPPQVSATVTAWSDQDLEFVVPQSAPVGATDIVVVVDGRASNALAFELLP